MQPGYWASNGRTRDCSSSPAGSSAGFPSRYSSLRFAASSCAAKPPWYIHSRRSAFLQKRAGVGKQALGPRHRTQMHSYGHHKRMGVTDRLAVLGMPSLPHETGRGWPRVKCQARQEIRT